MSRRAIRLGSPWLAKASMPSATRHFRNGETGLAEEICYTF